MAFIECLNQLFSNILAVAYRKTHHILQIQHRQHFKLRDRDMSPVFAPFPFLFLLTTPKFSNIFLLVQCKMNLILSIVFILEKKNPMFIYLINSKPTKWGLVLQTQKHHFSPLSTSAICFYLWNSI